MRATTFIIACLILCCVVTSASAADDEYSGNGYSEAPFLDTTRWIGFVYATIALAGVAVVGFKNAKRTHVD